MCGLAGVKEYRLKHKKDGSYVLQLKVVLQQCDYNHNKMKDVVKWEDVETVEEK